MKKRRTLPKMPWSKAEGWDLVFTLMLRGTLPKDTLKVGGARIDAVSSLWLSSGLSSMGGFLGSGLNVRILPIYVRRALPLLLLTSCGSEMILSSLHEKEANQIIELLADADIHASKGSKDTGRSVVFNLSVPRQAKLKAIRILNRYDMPRRADVGYAEVFKESGLIPTSTQEKAKNLAALEGEIERQIKLIDHILDAQVQLVMPEESPLRSGQDVLPTTTASVAIKYLPVGSASGSEGKPVTEQAIAQLVAAGVERLTPDHVTVFMTPKGGEKMKETPKGSPAPIMAAKLPGFEKFTPKQLQLVGTAMGTLVLLLALGLLVSQLQLRTVRGRLLRLQSEIAKARRKGATDIGAPPSLDPS